MKVQHHILFSGIFSSGIFFITNSLVISLVTFLSGVFIDLDHLIDYFINENKIKIDIKDFFYKCKNFKLKTATLIFHSYELLFVLLVLNIFFYDKLLLGLVLGFGSHILSDVIFGLVTNGSKILSYSILYRWIAVKFQFDKIFFKS